MSISFFEDLLLEEHIGVGGISHRELLETQTHFEEAKTAVSQAKKQGKLGFAKLPYATEDLLEIEALAERVADEVQTVVVIGVGGSDLGTRAIHRALNHQYYNLFEEARSGRPRLFFVGDTTDPVTLQELTDVISWPETTLIMVSKSGNTVEQMSTFIFLRQQLIRAVGEERAKRHVIMITDAEHGPLREITKQEGYRSLVIPSDVGGRYSVFSAVGLFPLAIAGIDTSSLLAGARAMDDESEVAARFAYLQYLAYTRHHQRISVLMPYTYSLREFGFWYRQLWAESLGKRIDRNGHTVEVGPTPVAALGPTDQHSQVQLYTEGPRDKVLTFLSVKNPAVDYSIPDPYPTITAVHDLHGHWFNEILLAEQKGTAKALAEGGRPSGHIEIEQLDAFSMGELIYFFELATAHAGELFNVNAYDQPGVERGKIITRELLDKK